MTPDGSLHQNLELKARLANPTVVAPALLALGAQSGGRLDQVDTYFVVPAGRLKLREIAGAEAQLIAYDRPETQAHRVSQFRVSRVVDPAGMRQVLSTSLGVLGTVSKRREL